MSKSIRQTVREQSVAMIVMQEQLVKAGLIATAAAVNIASQKLGWEAARIIERNEKREV